MIKVHVQGCSVAALDTPDGLLFALGRLRCRKAKALQESHNHDPAWLSSLCCRANLTLPNNVCEAVLRSLFWTPSELDKLREVCYQISV